MIASVIPLDVLPDPEHRPETSALLGEWADWLEATGRAERTIESYMGQVHRFLSRRYTRGRSLSEISTSEIVLHLAELGQHGPTRRQARVALSSLFGYLHRRGWLQDNPTALLEGFHEPRRRTKPAPYTVDELTQLLAAAAVRDPRRSWALQACFALGARRTEFVMLRPDDIDWATMRVQFRVTKRDKPRDVDMGPLAESALRELLAIGPDPRGTVQGTVLGIAPATFTTWVNDAARDCGFPPGRKRRAHTLRATFATHLGHAGVPVEVIRDLLGHSNIETTDQYLGVYDGDGAKAVRSLRLEAPDKTMLPGEWNLPGVVNEEVVHVQEDAALGSGPARLSQLAVPDRQRTADSLEALSADELARRLTPAQLEVLALVAQGLTNPEVARKREVSRSAVTNLVTEVFRKLGVRDRFQAAALGQVLVPRSETSTVLP